MTHMKPPISAGLLTTFLKFVNDDTITIYHLQCTTHTLVVKLNTKYYTFPCR